MFQIIEPLTSYEEDLTVKVLSYLNPCRKTVLFEETVEGVHFYNSWFYLDFGQSIYLRHGITFCIEVHPAAGAQYQQITDLQVEQSFQAANCSAISSLDVLPIRKFVEGSRSWKKLASQSTTCIVKSLTLSPFK